MSQVTSTLRRSQRSITTPPDRANEAYGSIRRSSTRPITVPTGHRLARGRRMARSPSSHQARGELARRRSGDFAAQDTEGRRFDRLRAGRGPDKNERLTLTGTRLDGRSWCFLCPVISFGVGDLAVLFIAGSGASATSHPPPLAFAPHRLCDLLPCFFLGRCPSSFLSRGRLFLDPLGGPPRGPRPHKRESRREASLSSGVCRAGSSLRVPSRAYGTERAFEQPDSYPGVGRPRPTRRGAGYRGPAATRVRRPRIRWRTGKVSVRQACASESRLTLSVPF